MPDSFVSAFILLLLVIDPLGNAVTFESMTRHLPPHRRKKIILRECVIGCVILLCFAMGGSYFLRYTGIQPSTLGITGGVLLFIIGLQMLFKGDITAWDTNGAVKSEPFIVPMAIPLFAGPSSIALTVINGAPGANDRWIWVAGMLAACASATLILVFSENLVRKLGPASIGALARLMGLMLAAAAIQMILDGFARYRGSLANG